MDAACTEVIESSFDAPEDWRLDHICYEDEYTRVSYIKKTRFHILVYRGMHLLRTERARPD